MLSDKQLKEMWDRLQESTPEEIEQRAIALREEVKQKFKEPFLNGLMETTRTKSKQVGSGMAKSLGYGPKFAPAIEAAILAGLFSPEMQALEKVCTYLAAAMADETVRKNPLALKLVTVAFESAEVASSGDAFDDLYWSIQQKARKDGVSLKASKVAKSKNAKPRAWVLTEWDNRLNKGEKKAAFARQFAGRLY